MARPETVVFEGRPGRLAPAAMIGFLSFFIAIALLASFTPTVYRDISGRIFPWLFAAMLIGFGCLIAIATSRRRKFEIDETGIRCTGRLRSNFNISWKEVSRIEMYRYRRDAPVTYVFRGAERATLAAFSPAEIGAAAAGSLASAVEKSARTLGLLIVPPK